MLTPEPEARLSQHCSAPSSALGAVRGCPDGWEKGATTNLAELSKAMCNGTAVAGLSLHMREALLQLVVNNKA